MDPRARADAVLARARARGGVHIVTPNNMTSPMDSSSTQQIPRSVVEAAEPKGPDPDSTMILTTRIANGLQDVPPPPPAVKTPPPEPEERVAPGPVPTVQQVASRPSLSQRLSGGQGQQGGLAGRLNGEG
ncbi:hypothetical protein CNX65_31190 [Actinosynnema pretiosum]|uniref:Uncharacterized protein n=1 Tax=Actinosynnema pretiosum TaxID=42197 RepID=A0A290ZDX2_9PSEU|nr:hypothetical protein CNX65_31190 [Actinosynnema pretiosum]